VTDDRPHPPEALPFAVAGFRGFVVPGLTKALATDVLPDPLRCARQGEPLRTSVSRLTSRVALADVGPVLLKVHRTRSLGERLLTLVRRGRAQAEWDAARFLAAAGLPVPPALAVGVQRRRGMIDTSFYAARFLERMRPADVVLPELGPEDRRFVLERLAVLIHLVHDADFDHRDLHAGNVLVGAGSGAVCELAITDLHRSRHGRPVGETARRQALASWLHSLRGLLDPPARRAWIATYLGAVRASEADAWFADVEARIGRLEQVRRRSRGKRCFRESTVYTLDVGGGWGARRRDLPLARLDAVLAAHAEASTPGRPGFVKRSRRGVVTRHGGIVVKERRSAGLLARLRDRVLPRRHAAGYRNAHVLDVLRVGTARPLAHVRRHGSSWTLYEDLGALPRLDVLARELYTRGARAEQVRLREATALWLGRLHREGIYHGDLKGVNVLVERKGDALGFRLIDTDRCGFFRRPVDGRRRLKNLSQLAASIPTCVSRTERLRWYRQYARAAGAAPSERRAAALVAQQLARKIVVVDEPIE